MKRFFRERSGGTPAGSRHRPALVDPHEPTFERVAKPGPDGARAGREPALALGTAEERGPDRRTSQEGSSAMSGAQLPFGLHGRQLCRGGARLLPGLASVASERAPLETSNPDRPRPARPFACSRPRSALAAASPSSSAGTSWRSRYRRRWPINSWPTASSPPGSIQPQHQVDFQAPVVLATAPAPETQASSRSGKIKSDEAGGVASRPRSYQTYLA